MTVKVNKLEESSEIEMGASASDLNKYDKVTKIPTDNRSSEIGISIIGNSSTATSPIEINTEDVIQVTKSSSLRDFISLSLSVGAEVRGI